MTLMWNLGHESYFGTALISLHLLSCLGAVRGLFSFSVVSLDVSDMISGLLVI